MTKTEFIKEAREKYEVAARYSGWARTMFLSGPKAKAAIKALRNKGFTVEISGQRNYVEV